MRLDLIINTMFKNGIRNREITVNNPSIWRPILSIEDAANAYIRAIEASDKISGMFNMASGNYTVGEVGDLVKMAIEEQLGVRVEADHPAQDGFPQLQSQHRQGGEHAELPSQSRRKVHCEKPDRQHGQVPATGIIRSTTTSKL